MQPGRCLVSASPRRLFASCSTSLSHVGGRPISIPASTSCHILPRSSLLPAQDSASSSSGQSYLQFSGPSGVQNVNLPIGLSARLSSSSLASESATLVLDCRDASTRALRSQWGLARALAANAVEGVSKGFTLSVRLVGVGYRASLEPITHSLPQSSSPSNQSPASRHQKLSPAHEPQSQSQQLVLRLGFPRPVRLPLPIGLSCTVSAPTDVLLSGPDRHLLGRFAADIRRWRPPEPYNGKGIFVGNESIRRKEVKKK